MGADRPGASERTRFGELYGEIPDGVSSPPPVASGRGGDGGEPVVQVVRGEPDAVELAALIAGLTAAAAAAPVDTEEAVRHRWTDRSHALRGGERGLPARGSDAWRWSLHP